MSFNNSLIKLNWLPLVIGIIIGALFILTIRFFAYSPPETHYHANFNLYLNSQREEFKAPQYYEEVEMCSADMLNSPLHRTHLHDNINDVVHVHDKAVTWGAFFSNIGWTLGPNFIADPTGKIYQTNDTGKLNIILNGQNYTGLGNISNKVIGDEDRLLISYGNNTKDELNTQFNNVASTAHHYDITKDPAACAGSESISFKERFKHLF
ncbi:MAG: hypothetical protein WCH00_02200 [Candidatus Saccharibacteria bacterium]